MGGTTFSAHGPACLTNLLPRLARYYLDLGFYSDRIELGANLQRRRMLWSLAAYGLLVLGLLAQQAIDLTRKPLKFSWIFDWSVMAASAIVGVALFAPFAHWVTRRRKNLTWEHVLWAFSFGFFINLSSNLIWKRFF
jgi:hypothetical protein